jgi:hypothetical protein
MYVLGNTENDRHNISKCLITVLFLSTILFKCLNVSSPVPLPICEWNGFKFRGYANNGDVNRDIKINGITLLLKI